MTENKYISTKDAAKLLGLSTRRVVGLCNKNIFDGAQKTGRDWKIPEASVLDYKEQYMMAQKAKLFHDSERYTKILRANTPGGCKALGKQVTPFDAKAWNQVKYDIVKAGNKANFEQNPDLLNMLLETENSIMAEASPKDKIWGIGMDAHSASQIEPSEWPGQNLLGKPIDFKLTDNFPSAGQGDRLFQQRFHVF